MNIRRHTLPLTLLGLLWMAYSLLVVGELNGPMEGSPDLAGWDFSGYYLLRNLHFTPFPQIQFQGNQLLYPFGTTAVFQSWGLERDYLYAVLRTFFGRGPWLQLYFMASTFLTVFFVYGLLAEKRAKAFIIAALTAFWNIYALHKYPHHFGISIVHWSVISIVIDFVIYRRFYLRQPISLALLLLRTLVLTLCLGQELAYVAGIGLCSFTITGTCLLALFFKRRYAGKRLGYQALIGQGLGFVATEFRNHKRACYSLFGLNLMALYFYLPIILQIVFEMRRFSGPVMHAGTWFANPIRLLLPYFTFFQPNTLRLNNISLFDIPEAFGAASPGWTVLFLGLCGLYYGRRHWHLYLPAMLLFLAVILYHPSHFPTLKVFPWYRYARVGTRMTFALTPLLLLGVYVLPWSQLAQWKRWRIAIMALALLVLESEIVTSYHRTRPRQLTPAADFFDYMETVKKASGEAVLDWPLCILGGNYTAHCPFQDLATVYAWQKYHDKKVANAYFGRLHPDMAKRWQDSGLFKLSEAMGSRCLNDKEFATLRAFMKQHNFAGMNLYLRFVKPGCRELFHRWFGSPAARTSAVRVGEFEFLPLATDE